MFLSGQDGGQHQEVRFGQVVKPEDYRNSFYFFIEHYLDFVIEINWPLFKYRIYHHNFDCFFLMFIWSKGPYRVIEGPWPSQKLERGTCRALNFQCMHFHCVEWYWRMPGRLEQSILPASPHAKYLHAISRKYLHTILPQLQLQERADSNQYLSFSCN